MTGPQIEQRAKQVFPEDSYELRSKTKPRRKGAELKNEGYIHHPVTEVIQLREIDMDRICVTCENFSAYTKEMQEETGEHGLCICDENPCKNRQRLTYDYCHHWRKKSDPTS